MKSLFTVAIVGLFSISALSQDLGESPIENLPSYIKQVTSFGQRADWSHDGQRLLFIEKPFGDVFEVEVATGVIKPMTHHFFHEGFLRALYLSNGDILLSGAREFDSKNPWRGRDSQHAELWVLKKDLSGPPRPLLVNCKEGPAVSRTALKIAWTIGPLVTIGDIEYKDGQPHLINRKVIFESKDLPHPVGNWNMETQNFKPGKESELIFYAHGEYEGYGAEVMGYNMEYDAFINYTNSVASYDEAEGTFPDGQSILVESNRHRLTYKNLKSFQIMDLYRLRLDGSGQIDRMTYFNENPNYKASNGVVSDDGKYVAFQYARSEEAAGIGRGLLILDVAEWEKTLE